MGAVTDLPVAPTRDVTAAIYTAICWLLSLFVLLAMSLTALLVTLLFLMLHSTQAQEAMTRAAGSDFPTPSLDTPGTGTGTGTGPPVFPKSFGVTVDLGYAQYRGLDAGSDVRKWLGIRYAAPPLGDLRFRGPRDPIPNPILQDANIHGPLCLSTPSTSLANPMTAAEDCLFLDVYAPSIKTGTPHPVFVFIQGGGFNTNANPNLDGRPLVVAGDHDIVVVTFNYRVGPWGFLTSKEVQGNGDLNVGLLDQRKVLQWVQKHVTIGGSSAGAASVDHHLSAFGGRDDGLFHAAAAQSQSYGPQFTVEEAQYQYNGLIQRTGCATSPDTLSCLRDLPAARLAQNNINLPTPGGPGGMPLYMYAPVIDGTYSPDYTYNLMAQGKFIKVPVIFGGDTNEGTIFTPPDISSQLAVNNFLRNNWVNLTDTHLSQITTFYPPGPAFPAKSPFWRAAANAYGEIRYICPGIFMSSKYPQYGVADSWNYRWDVLNDRNAASGLGVTHTAELASLFGISSLPDRALIPAIQGYWTSFIRSKDPNRYKLASAPSWARFEDKSMSRLLFPNDPTKVTMESVPPEQRERCAFLSSIGASIAQ